MKTHTRRKFIKSCLYLALSGLNPALLSLLFGLTE